MAVATLKWIKASSRHIPKNAVEGGKIGKEIAYVGRVNTRERLIPGRVTKSNGCHFNDGNECCMSQYEVLVCPRSSEALDWVKTTGNKIPPNAVEGGYEEPGKPYYIGRAQVVKGKKKDLVPGKVDPRTGVLTVSSSTGEVATHNTFEILVFKGEVEIIEEISQQILSDVIYDTSSEAIKHTKVPNVALANVPMRNASTLTQKIKTSTSLFITEIFSWTDKVARNMISAPKTEFQCGVPYFSFEDNTVYVSTDGVLPIQMIQQHESPDNLHSLSNHPMSVVPRVKSAMVAGRLPPDFDDTFSYNREGPLTTTYWGNPISHYIIQKQEISANVPPCTALTVVVEGTKHILEVPYVANLSKTYNNGMTAEEEYRGTFQSTWFSDIGVGYSKEEAI